MTEHVDSDRLYTDVRYRFEYISKFINFTSADITALNTFGSIALPSLPVIVDSVYRKFFQYDIIKNHFILHNEYFHDSSTRDDNLTLESKQMIYRQDMLSKYLKRLLSEQKWSDEFLEYISKVGRMHTNKAGSASINVDYIHINAAFTYLENLLVESVWSCDKFDNNARKSILLALNKVFRIQSDLFLMHYLEPATTPSKTNRSKDRCTPS